MGNFTRAAPHFRQGYANVQPPFNVWTETPGGGTVNFITGAGGFLQVGWVGLGVGWLEPCNIAMDFVQ